jgi:MFS transporter, DHA1 family, tetracycline resistance protein
MSAKDTWSCIARESLRRSADIPVGHSPIRQSASVGVVLLTVAIDALAFGIIAPIMPDLVQQLSGLSGSGTSFYMGLQLATFAITQFLCAPLLGGISDRYGRRPVLLLSLAGACANYLLLAWAPTLTWLFIGQAISGATVANISAANAYVADVTPAAERAQRFGLIGATFALGFVLGPAVGGILGSYGLRLPFVIAAVLAGGNVLYGVLALSESLPPDRRRRFEWQSADPVRLLHAVASDSTYARLAVAWCCIWIAFGALQSGFVLANEMRLGWSTQQNGMALVTLGIGAAFAQGIIVKRVIRRLGEKRTAAISILLAACAYLCFAFADVGWLVFLGISLQALGAMSMPSIQAMVSTHTDPDRQGEAQGALGSLRGLTAIGAPLIAGSLLALFTRGGLFFPGAPFLFAALTYGGAFIAVRGIVARDPAA